MGRVDDAIARDEWAMVESERDAGPVLLRVRTPVIARGDAGAHTQLLQIVWTYADEDTGAMPSDADSAAMESFENLTCAAWERDALAFLAAVLTFDGARQWVFYTRDVRECGERLDVASAGQPRWPIELTTKHDPDWRFLHDDLLGPFASSLSPDELGALYHE